MTDLDIIGWDPMVEANFLSCERSDDSKWKGLKKDSNISLLVGGC